MPEPLVLWYADKESWTARQVECPAGSFPATDAEGRKVCDNTHFDTEPEAWRALGRESDAWVELAGSSVAQAERDLEEARKRAGEAAMARCTFRENCPEEHRRHV